MSDKTAALAEAPKKASGHAGFLKANLREYGMLLSLFAIMLFFEIVTDGTLLRPLNLTNLVLQNSYIVIMALGMLLVIVTGHIDLSVGSVAGFIGAIAAVLMVRYGMHFIPAAIICLALGGADRRGAGLLGGLFQDPVLHRHAGRHAGVQGAGAGGAAGPVGRPVLADVPETLLRIHSGIVSRRRRAQPHLAADRRRAGAWSGLCQRHDPRPARQPWCRGRAHRLLCAQERDPVRRGDLFHLSDRLASRPAQRAGDHDRTDRAVWFRHRANHHRPADLCGRRQ